MNNYLKHLFIVQLFLAGCLVLPMSRTAASELDTTHFRSATIHVKPSRVIGQVKPLHGGNLAVPLVDGLYLGKVRETFRRLKIPYTRLHDVPLQNPGMRIVDIPLIFPDFRADAEDEGAYYFDQTDDYIRDCIADSTEVYYRLGTSIEHSIKKYFVHPPKDVKKWIDVASNIIRHYTEGKWNGFRFPITYWEIWNEPDVDSQKMWTGSLDEFNAFYVEVATALKKRFPHLKFGGPAHCSPKEKVVRGFLSACAEKKAPLDFYSFHCYTDDDKRIIGLPARMQQYLDEYGYHQTELHLNEWNYIYGGFWKADAKASNDWFKVIRGAEGAAFVNTVLIGWQDTPLDVACYYTIVNLSSSRWGLFNSDGTVSKAYYGMLAFGDVAEYGNRVGLDADLPDGSRALAARDSHGNLAILASCWKSGALDLSFDIESMGEYERVEVYRLDDHSNLAKCMEVGHVQGPLKVRTDSESAIWLVKCYK